MHLRRPRPSPLITGLIAVCALLAGCTAGDQTGADPDTADPTNATPGSGTPGASPGVTDDSIKIGITYVDLASISDVVDIDHGDYEATYQALFDDINADGGINGRTIEPIYAPIDPVGVQDADFECVNLTEDEDVFAVIGFFLEDNVLCPVGIHATAVIGGAMNPERLQRAQAPWFTTEGGTDLQLDTIREMVDQDVFDGTLGVYARPSDQAQMDDIVLPLLEELGVEVADAAIVDAPDDDTAATNAATAVIAERFESEGVDQVLIVGNAGLLWAGGVEPLDYRPQLLITDVGSVAAYTLDGAGRDLSVIEGAVSGGTYGGVQAIYDLDTMQDCIATLEDHGVVVPEPDSLGRDGQPLFVAGFTACKDVTLLRALLEGAGPDLDYGSFAAAADGLEVAMPVQPDPMTYGPPPAADGDPTAYLFDWDPEANDFVPREE